MSRYKIALTLCCLFIATSFFSCDDEPIDPALQALINTPETPDCIAPQSFAAAAMTPAHSVYLSWVAAEGTGAWQVQYGESGFIPGSGTSVTATDTHVTISGLTSTATYQFYIRTVCTSTSFSQWFGPVMPGTSVGSCNLPTGLNVIRAADNASAAVSWNVLSGVVSYQIQYGATGFMLGTGTLVSATASPRTITGLTASQGYDFYLRSNCSISQSSEWAGPFHVNGSTGNPITYDFMSANVNGVQLNNMKPYFYPIQGEEAKLVTLSGNQGRTLQIQGDSLPLGTAGTGVEINLEIHEDYWQPGTHPLIMNGSGTWPAATSNLIDFTNDSPEYTLENEQTGTITVLEFNAVTKRIKGTFSFPYKVVTNGVETGPFQVGNGTFDYPVPDEAFIPAP